MEQKIIFNADDVNITEIMAQIHAGLKSRGYDVEELKRLGKGLSLPKAPVLTENSGSRMAEIMTNVNLTNHVEYWWQIPPQRDFRGKLRVIANKVTRKLSYFYLKHTFDQQNIFNANVTLALTELSNRLTETENQVQALADENRRLKAEKEEYRFDYFGFENRFRGTDEEIRNRQKRYLPYFEVKKNVLDFGCGRGEFLELLKEHGISAKGVDIEAKNIECCKKRHVEAVTADGFGYLEALPDNSLDGFFSAQVIEHLSTEQLIRLIRLAYRKLKKGSVMLLETLNPECLKIFAESLYLDPSHLKPVHPLTLEFIAESEGFSKTEILYMTPTEGMSLCTDYSEENIRGARMAADLLFGDREYALAAIK